MRKKGAGTSIEAEKEATLTITMNNKELNCGELVRNSMRTAMALAKESYGAGKYREIIAAQMTVALTCETEGATVTRGMIDKWMAPGAEGYRFPLEYLPAFCAATRCDLPLSAVAGFMGYTIADENDSKWILVIRKERQIRQLQEEIDALKKEVRQEKSQ